MIVLLFPFYFYPRYLPVSPQKQAELREIEALQDRRQMVRVKMLFSAKYEEYLQSSFASLGQFRYTGMR